MHKNIKIITCLTIIMILLLGASAQAQDVKSRMRDRLPKIIDLKSKGLIGENNQGYLEIRKEGAAHKAIVTAENKDRREVYEAIAKKAKTSADVVGRRRAIQIAEKAAKGEWLQNADGKWYQKP